MDCVAPQNRHAVSVAEAFLRVHWDQKKPLLLGYSGGPDSKALLYALLECGVKPHLAYVDHGWREESRQEAALLAEEARGLGLVFHTTRVSIEKKEDAARNARLKFFKELIPDYSALLLAHQADDLAETVLKRIFEGAHLPFLGGMREISNQHEMTIWRPFLSVKRTEILIFLEERGLKALVDSSNFDPKYLRARMRSGLFPLLNEHFGKEIGENLDLLSVRAYELKSYLDEKVKAIKIEDGAFNLNGFARIEQRHFLQSLGVFLSRQVLETLLDWLEMGGKKRSLKVQKRKFTVDQGRLWIVFEDLNNS